MKAIGTGNKGASATMTMRMANIEFEYNVTALPLEKWHQQMWNAQHKRKRNKVNIKQLRMYWRKAMQIRPSRWAQVRGPVGAISMSAQRMGWRVHGEHQDDQGRWVQLDATRWMDDRNTVIQLTRMSPKMLRHMLKASIDRKEQ